MSAVSKSLIRHGNSVIRLVRRMPKADPWDVYDALPAPIRAALQEGPEALNPLWARSCLRRFRRRDEDEAAAVLAVVGEIGWIHRHDIAKAAPWQPPGHGRRPSLPSPHFLARATMQTSRRGVAP